MEQEPQRSLNKILFGSPFSERGHDACRAFRQSERELVDVIALKEGVEGEHTETVVACKRAIVLFAIWRDPEIAHGFRATDAKLLDDLKRRILPLAGPIFLANLGQRPDAFVALCAVMWELWPDEKFWMAAAADTAATAAKAGARS
jgi:hypothetical protein